MSFHLGPGLWLVFGVIGLPVYSIILGWLLGEPRDRPTTFLGLGVLIGITTMLWVGLFITTLIIGLVYFTLPSPF